MINFILPHFYKLNKINDYLVDMTSQNPDWFIEPTIFSYADGFFPFSISAGKAYYNSERVTALYQNIVEISDVYNRKNLNLILDFSNLLLTEDQLINDNYLSLALSLNNNGANLIKISDITTKTILQKLYPYYNYVFEDKGSLSVENINTILADEKIVYFYLHPNFKDEDLSLLNNRNKIVIKVNNRCKGCNAILSCFLLDSQAVQEYSEESVYNKCQKLLPMDTYISIPQIKQKYQKEQINTFIFEDFYSNWTDHNILGFLADYFIKVEYRSAFLGGYQ